MSLEEGYNLAQNLADAGRIRRKEPAFGLLSDGLQCFHVKKGMRITGQAVADGENKDISLAVVVDFFSNSCFFLNFSLSASPFSWRPSLSTTIPRLPFRAR